MLQSKRIILLACLLSAVLVFTAACSAADGGRTVNEAAEPGAAGTMQTTTGKSKYSAAGTPMEDAFLMIDSADTNGVFQPAAVERKVIKNATFSLQTKDYVGTMSQLEAQIEAFGGYIERSNRYGDQTQGDASSHLTIRIPEDRYEEFKAFVPTIGNVTSSSEGGDDVTTQYYDTDTRLRVLQTQEERILELLSQAQNVEEMLQIENELTRIRTEIEQLTTTLKQYDSLVSYATFELDIMQAAEYIVPEDGFGTRILRTLRNSGKAAVAVLQGLILFLIWALPYLVVIGVVLVIVLVCVRRKKRAAKVPEAEPPAEDAPEEPTQE